MKFRFVILIIFVLSSSCATNSGVDISHLPKYSSLVNSQDHIAVTCARLYWSDERGYFVDAVEINASGTRQVREISDGTLVQIKKIRRKEIAHDKVTTWKVFAEVELDSENNKRKIMAQAELPHLKNASRFESTGISSKN